MKPALLPASRSTIQKTFSQIADLCHEKISPEALQAISLYRKPRNSSNASIIATEYGSGADQSYRHFYQTSIADKSVPIGGTSLTDIVNGKKDVVYQRSGYRADQYCYNMSLGQDHRNADPHYIVQMVFRTGADYASLLHEDDIRVLPEIVQQSGAMQLDFSACEDSCQTHMSQAERQAMMLFWDMSGYKHMVRMHGVQQAQDFIQTMRSELLRDFYDNYACDMLRSEGDGVWLSYPVTGFSEQEADGFAKLFLKSSEEILQRYDAVRSHSDLAAVQESFIKVALMQVSALDISEQDSRLTPFIVESDSFVRGRLLMNHAPRDRDVIVIDPALQNIISRVNDTFLKRADTLVPAIAMPF